MRRHDLDGVSLGFGLFFVLSPLLWVTLRDAHLRLPDLGWFLAGALIVVGVLGAVGAFRGGRTGGDQPPPA